MTTPKKLVPTGRLTAYERQLVDAAFKGGWAAACLTIAEECERHGGGPDLSSVFREMAKHPHRVEAFKAEPGGEA